ncbi:MAG: outer membrane lipoprotein-sorting protein [Phycisphaera sp.]|nr:outer membrane lipoprotein-sorting protein [Phycisphaera sp.]
MLAGLLIVHVSVLFTQPTRAQGADDKPVATPGVEEIVHHANYMAYYQGRDGRAKVTMTITDSQGRQRNRQFTIPRRDDTESEDLADAAYRSRQKFYVYFHQPPDVAGTVFMVHKHLTGDDDRWLYLPGLDLVKRIAATDKRTSFVGSDFFYEDVSGRSIDLDEHELTQTTDNYFVLKNTPKDPDSVEFSHYVMYLHRASFIPVQTIYYDKNGEKYRVYKALKVETIGGHPTVTRSTMQNLKTGSTTDMTYTDVKYDTGIPDEVFTERYLRKPPAEYLGSE